MHDDLILSANKQSSGGGETELWFPGWHLMDLIVAAVLSSQLPIVVPYLVSMIVFFFLGVGAPHGVFIKTSGEQGLLRLLTKMETSI